MKKRTTIGACCLLLTVSLLLCGMPVVAAASPNVSGTHPQTAEGGESYRVSSRLLELLRGQTEQKNKADGERMLIPGGHVFGVQLAGCGVTVRRVSDSHSPLRAEDRILSLNGRRVQSAAQVRSLIQASRGSLLRMEVEREGKTYLVELHATQEGEDYRLGVTLSDGAAGIGTVTYMDPDTGAFGGLGHGICEADSGELLPMSEGTVTGVILGGVTRGQVGHPGELRGVLTSDTYGRLSRNTECGVFGQLTDPKPLMGDATPLAIARRADVHEGEAEIISTVKNGMCARYTVQISDIDLSSRGSKSFRLHVADPALLALTGGIVRGMSGSPILQDGRIVGAVTHVLIQDPTTGYGIFIENMLEAAAEQPQAA